MDWYVMVSPDNSLCHHGIKGQKWGVRRYRNEDGSLTEAGKKRLYKIDEKLEKIDKKYNKLQQKANKRYKRADKKAASFFSTSRSINKAYQKADKAQSRVLKWAAKGAKYYEKNKEKFEDINAFLNPDSISRGEEFVKTLNEYSKGMYYSRMNRV